MGILVIGALMNFVAGLGNPIIMVPFYDMTKGWHECLPTAKAQLVLWLVC